jgi:hypothetical protein
MPTIPITDQVLTYQGHTLDNSLSLLNYKIAFNGLTSGKSSTTGLSPMEIPHSSSGGISQDK